jgi:hypothetical protein
MFVEYWQLSNAGKVYSLRALTRVMPLRLVCGTYKATVVHCLGQDRLLGIPFRRPEPAPICLPRTKLPSSRISHACCSQLSQM